MQALRRSCPRRARRAAKASRAGRCGGSSPPPGKTLNCQRCRRCRRYRRYREICGGIPFSGRHIYYSGRGGFWKKAVFHENMQQSIIDLNRYRTPDLTLLDARTGLACYHLAGPCCDPPVNRIVAGFDPLAVDREAARLLGLDWRTIGHLQG